MKTNRKEVPFYRLCCTGEALQQSEQLSLHAALVFSLSVNTVAYIFFLRLFCHFYRSLLFKLIWLLHFGSLNHWTWACGSSFCSSTSFLKPGKTHSVSPPSLSLPLFAIYHLPSFQPVSFPQLCLSR